MAESAGCTAPIVFQRGLESYPTLVYNIARIQNNNVSSRPYATIFLVNKGSSGFV